MSIKVVNTGEEYQAIAELRKNICECIDKFLDETQVSVSPEMVGSVLAMIAGQAYKQETCENPLMIAEMAGINALEGMGHRDLAMILCEGLEAKRRYFPKQTKVKADR